MTREATGNCSASLYECGRMDMPCACIYSTCLLISQCRPSTIIMHTRWNSHHQLSLLLSIMAVSCAVYGTILLATHAAVMPHHPLSQRNQYILAHHHPPPTPGTTATTVGIAESALFSLGVGRQRMSMMHNTPAVSMKILYYDEQNQRWSPRPLAVVVVVTCWVVICINGYVCMLAYHPGMCTDTLSG